MAERRKFKCWNCPEEYSLLRDTEGVRILLVKCPYCGVEAEVDLKPYESQARDIYKTADSPAGSLGTTYNLPDVLPTRPRSQPAEKDEDGL